MLIEAVPRHKTTAPSSVNHRRLALLILFFIPGVAMASWVTRTPAIRDGLSASTAEMGLVLFGLSIGSMSGILSSGPLVRRLGTRPVIAIGILLIAASLAAIALGASFANAAIVSFGLFLFGAGAGSGEVAMNIEGAEVESLIKRSFLPTLHGCFSLGMLVGALAGIGLTATNVPVSWHLLGTLALIVAPAALSMRAIPAGVGKFDPHAASGEEHGLQPSVWSDRKLICIGLIVLAMALSEGSAYDWLPLLMIDGHGFDPTSGTLIFTVFAAAMVVGRFSGSFLIDKFGRVSVIRGSAAFCALGLAMVIFADNQIMAGSAVILWGLGASLGFPVTLSAAGDTGPNPAARVSAVATAGYMAFLVGPPTLGFLGEHYGLRIAMIVVLAAVAGAIVLAPATRRTSVDRGEMI